MKCKHLIFKAETEMCVGGRAAWREDSRSHQVFLLPFSLTLLLSEGSKHWRNSIKTTGLFSDWHLASLRWRIFFMSFRSGFFPPFSNVPFPAFHTDVCLLAAWSRWMPEVPIKKFAICKYLSYFKQGEWQHFLVASSVCLGTWFSDAHGTASS